MKLKTKYLLFVITLHLVTLVLSYFIFYQDKILFIASEVFVMISLLVSWNLYNQLIRPLKTLMQGIEALKDRDFNVKFLKTGKHEVDQLIGVYNQMMDELKLERTRQEQQHFFLEKLIQTSPSGIIILDFDGNVQQMNPKAFEILSIDNRNSNLNNIEVPELFKNHIDSLKAGESKTIKIEGINTYKIQKSHFIDRGFAHHFITIEELTQELLAAEKTVYGKVIRMMAHEVNNTIGPVNSIIDTALKTNILWNGHDFNYLKDALQVALDRNQNLNIFMRNFADLVKLPSPHKKRVDLHQLLHSVKKLMEIKAAERLVEIHLETPATPYYIMADEQQMEQALINIIKNAIEAIDPNGKVTLLSDPSEKQLVIIDNGKGISAEQSGQLFTPFFSTKKDGQGIGLTLVREILLNHGFDFSLKTLSADRTEFTIIFNQ